MTVRTDGPLELQVTVQCSGAPGIRRSTLMARQPDATIERSMMVAPNRSVGSAGLSASGRRWVDNRWLVISSLPASFLSR